MKYMITSDYDGNESFEVEADTDAQAAFHALGQLGWGVVKLQDEETDDEETTETL